MSRDFSPFTAVPDRAAGLGGRLPRFNAVAEAPAADDDAAAESLETAQTPTGAEQTAPKEQRSGRSTGSPKSAGRATGNAVTNASPPTVNRPKGVIVYLNPEQTEFLKRVADVDGITYADVVLDALERHWDALADVWSTRTRGYGLPPRKQRATGSLRTQVQLKLRPDALSVLDARVEETGAPSRNALIGKLIELDMAQLGQGSTIRDLSISR